MIRIFRALAILLCLLALPRAGATQEDGWLDAPARPQSHGFDDRRFLQAALAFEGHYAGLLDGDWGRLSDAALTRFATREFESEPRVWHLAVLALGLTERIDAEGWAMQPLGGMGVSLLYPMRTGVEEGSDNGLRNWRHRGSSLGYTVGRHYTATAESLHAWTMNRHAGPGQPYLVRRPGFLVTRVQTPSGTLYTRSDYVGGEWTTVILSADAADRALLDAVSGSIVPGSAPALRVTQGGRLDAAIRAVLRLIAEGEPSETGVVAAAPSPPPGKAGGSGSGFYVSQSGHVLTNAHVVEGCAAIAVDGKPARLLDVSEDFDLALLLAPPRDDKAVAVFAAQPAQLNEDVTAVGYPLAGLLGGINVTRGSVASVTGLGGDRTRLQITAPVQPGNSGGPIVGPDGAVLGVVVSKLDALKAAALTGDLPQNVNFAVSGEIAKLFLGQNGLRPALGQDGTALPPVPLAARAAAFTAFVTCD